jgi:cyclopropane-fatty-acyl-phospholipid synthase
MTMLEATEDLPFQPKPLGFVDQIAKRILSVALGGMKFGSVVVTWPDGSKQSFGRDSSNSVDVTIADRGVLRRVLLGGAMGFAEAYMAGQVMVSDMPRLIRLVIQNETDQLPVLQGSLVMRLWHKWRHFRRSNSKVDSRRNISFHYDLGNDFYRLWLDPTMTYSSALFETPEQSLQGAQTAKYRQIAKLAQISPGDKVLEIGCGWGGFAEMAAGEIGCHVKGLTLSQEQARYARARLSAAKLDTQTDVVIEDYRDCQGEFDAVVSIEMFEAIGERHWPLYFQRLRDRLKPGKFAALQIITIAEERFETYRANADFIQRYVFPGGMLPTKSILENISRQVGLDVVSMRAFGQSYARTLAMWRESFHASWSSLSHLGFDQRFRNMWDYYLCYCQAGFEMGCIDVVHLQVRRPG